MQNFFLHPKGQETPDSIWLIVVVRFHLVSIIQLGAQCDPPLLLFSVEAMISKGLGAWTEVTYDLPSHVLTLKI